MNIGLITLEGGGISTVCYGLAENLSKNKVYSTIFTEKSNRKTVDSFYQKTFKLNRLEIPPRFLWFQLQNYRKFGSWLNEFDVIHGVYPDAAALLPVGKKPFVVSFHSEPYSCLKSFVQSPISSWSPPEFAHYVMEYPFFESNIRRNIKRADHIILCSFSALEEFKRINKNIDPSKVSVIYNSVNLSKFEKPENVSARKTDEKLRILFAGRLFWQKGCMFLLKAFEQISKQFDVRLDIYGKGPEEEKLKQFVCSRNLSDKVFFNGRVSNQFLLSQMKQSDLIVSPSFREAQSMFVLEAMASKKPVIAFDIPASKEVITDGFNGFLAKTGDADDLYDKMYRVLSDLKLRLQLGTNAYEYIKLKHNWDIQIKKYMRVYEELL